MSQGVLITGASGFLGAHVCNVMAKAGWRVHAALRPSSLTNRLTVLCPDARIELMNFEADAQVLVDRLAGLDVAAIVHCAAYGVDFLHRDVAEALKFNVGVPVRLVEAAALARLARFVHVGTSSEYGPAPHAIDESTPLNPVGIYGSSKAAGLVIARERAMSLGLSFVAARTFGMYGPLEGSHKFVPQVMAAARAGKSLDLTAGEQIRDYTYVGDVARACEVMAGGTGQDGLIVNLASGRPLSLRGLAEAAVSAIGGGGGLNWGAKPYRPNEPMSVIGDASLAATVLDWSAKTNLSDGMMLTADFERFRSEHL